MGLQVWLPLNGTTKSQGAKEIQLTNYGATVDSTDGILGACYSFTGTSNQYLEFDRPMGAYYNDDFSWTLWVYPTTAKRGILLSEGGGASGSGSGEVAFELTATLQVRVYWDANPNILTTYTLPLNTWTHIAVTKTSNQILIYINGALNFTHNQPEGFSKRTSSKIARIGDDYRSGTTVDFAGKLNDFRIYNHALSPFEVKEISRGLIRHYKFDDPYVSDNLIINGFGELGSEGWVNSSRISTTEIPPDHPDIKASFYSGNTTDSFLSINPNHSYTISGFIKSSGATSGTTYPSIYPYDADKKFIATQNCTEGFKNTYRTTLAQPLNKGDTVIYAANLSAWTTGDNYYNYVAIFGYRNSSGYVYPDMVYTQDSLAFGTKQDKSHIDKENNTITLNAPFTGEPRPAGTTICQATAGSTYYYPWGGISLASIQDWVFKTATFKPKSVNRLKACRYIKWSTYGNCYIAGNKLVDNFETSGVICDCSGYGNHGTKSGTLTISESTARNSLSTVFNGTDGYVECDPLPTETKSISFWLKTTWSSTSTSKVLFADKVSELAFGVTSSNRVYLSANTSMKGYNFASIGFVANQWNHIVILKTSESSRDMYVNGVKATKSGSNDNWTMNLNNLIIGCRYSSTYSAYFDGQLSDFRAYVTELSQEDVLSLYHVGAKITNTGEFHNYELVENTTATTTSVKNTGVAIATANGINENMLKTVPKLVSPTQYNAYQLAFTENLIAGQTYTLQLWDVDVSHTGKTEAQLGVWVYWGGESINLFSWSGTSNFTNGHADYLVKTFTVTSSQASWSGARNPWFNIYNSVGYVAGTMNMRIGKWKLEKGSIPTAYVDDPTYSGYLGVNHGFIENDLLPRNSVATKIHKGYIEAKEFIED